MVRRLIWLTAAILLLAVACGDDDAPADDGPPGAGPYPVADLTVLSTNVEAGVDRSYRVTCQGDTASISGDSEGVSAEAACLALADPAVALRLIHGPPDDQVCSEQYGGADEAQIGGTLGADMVTATIDRTNGCGINDWDVLLRDLLPEPVGAPSG